MLTQGVQMNFRFKMFVFPKKELLLLRKPPLLCKVDRLLNFVNSFVQPNKERVKE